MSLLSKALRDHHESEKPLSIDPSSISFPPQARVSGDSNLSTSDSDDGSAAYLRRQHRAPLRRTASTVPAKTKGRFARVGETRRITRSCSTNRASEAAPHELFPTVKSEQRKPQSMKSKEAQEFNEMGAIKSLDSKKEGVERGMRDLEARVSALERTIFELHTLSQLKRPAEGSVNCGST